MTFDLPVLFSPTSSASGDDNGTRPSRLRNPRARMAATCMPKILPYAAPMDTHSRA